MPKRSAVDMLPADIKAELDGRLIQNSFSDYRGLADWLSTKGFCISKDSVYRYGSKFQERCEMLKISTESARDMKAVLGDDDATVAEMSLQLAQGLLFKLMMERGEQLSPKEIGMITRALSDSTRSSVAVKRYQEELKKQIEAKLKALEAENHPLSMSVDPQTLKRVREEVYGLF